MTSKTREVEDFANGIKLFFLYELITPLIIFIMLSKASKISKILGAYLPNAIK